MASHVQIILKKDTANLGNQGDLVKVRPGYARNYLIPRGIAVLATRANQEQVDHVRRLAFARLEKVKDALRERAKVIEGLRIQIAKEAGDEGKLFGSVTAQEVAEAFEAHSMEVDRRKIEMPEEPIRMTGPYKLRLKLGTDVYAVFRLDVTTKA